MLKSQCTYWVKLTLHDKSQLKSYNLLLVNQHSWEAWWQWKHFTFPCANHISEACQEVSGWKFDSKVHCTLSLKFSHAFFSFFVFLILSHQNACYVCENAENWTWYECFYDGRKFHRQYVIMIDPMWVLFFICKNVCMTLRLAAHWRILRPILRPIFIPEQSRGVARFTSCHKRYFCPKKSSIVWCHYNYLTAPDWDGASLNSNSKYIYFFVIFKTLDRAATWLGMQRLTGFTINRALKRHG